MKFYLFEYFLILKIAYVLIGKFDSVVIMVYTPPPPLSYEKPSLRR